MGRFGPPTLRSSMMKGSSGGLSSELERSGASALACRQMMEERETLGPSKRQEKHILLPPKRIEPEQIEAS